MDTMSTRRTQEDRRAFVRTVDRRKPLPQPINRDVHGIQKATHLPNAADYAFVVYQVFNTDGEVIAASRQLLSVSEWRRLLAL